MFQVLTVYNRRRRDKEEEDRRRRRRRGRERRRGCDEVELSESWRRIPCSRLGSASFRSGRQLLSFSSSPPVFLLLLPRCRKLQTPSSLAAQVCFVARMIWSLYTCVRACVRASRRGDPHSIRLLLLLLLHHHRRHASCNVVTMHRLAVATAAGMKE